MLQRKDIVSTFGIKQGVRVCLIISFVHINFSLVGILNFARVAAEAYSYRFWNHQGIFNVRNLHTGPPRFFALVREG